MLCCGPVRILCGRGGGRRCLLLRVLLWRTRRRRNRVDHDDIPGRDGLGLDGCGHFSWRHRLGDGGIGRLRGPSRPDRIRMGFDRLRIIRREPTDKVSHLLLRRRNQTLLNR